MQLAAPEAPPALLPVAQTKQKPGDVLGGNAEAEDSQDDGGAGAEPRFDKPDTESEVSIKLIGELFYRFFGDSMSEHQTCMRAQSLQPHLTFFSKRSKAPFGLRSVGSIPLPVFLSRTDVLAYSCIYMCLLCSTTPDAVVVLALSTFQS